MSENNQLDTQDTNEEDSNEEDPISDSFKGVIMSLNTFKSQINAIQQQIRFLEKKVNRELNVSRKELQKRKEKKAKRKPSGFAKPGKISSELSLFMSKKEGELVARTEVTKHIINYIKDLNLQNSNNKKVILPNKELKKLLNVSDDEEVTYFNLQKYMNHHFI